MSQPQISQKSAKTTKGIITRLCLQRKQEKTVSISHQVLSVQKVLKNPFL